MLKKETEGVFSLSELIDEGKALLQKGERQFVEAEIDSDAMSVILFTSGTTGASKGVMLNHKNLAADLMVSPTVLKVNTWDIFFSVLPLHHTYECTCGFLMPLYKGAGHRVLSGIEIHCEKSAGGSSDHVSRRSCHLRKSVSNHMEEYS